MRIHARTTTPGATCPDCAHRSERVHSRYQRHLSDAAIGGAETLVCLRVRPFACENPDCARTTFAEQVPRLTTADARQTPLLRGMPEHIALALGGRPGERVTQRLAMAVSGMTLLRLIRALPVPEPGVVTALGVDDFAFRKGKHYGSILVDMHTHRPVELLPDRLSDTFADRFHLLDNLTVAVDRVVRAHRKCPHEQAAVEAVAQPAPPTAVVDGRRAKLTRQRWAEVHALWDKGVGTTAISRALNLDDKTVRRYARAATALACHHIFRCPR